MKNKIICLIALISFFHSCMKDKGNYDYNFDLEPELTIDTLPGQMPELYKTWDVGAKITYEPKVEYKNGNEKNLTYTWFVMNYVYRQEQVGNSLQYPAPDTICTTKKLDYLVDLTPGNQYQLHLTVRDTVTGISVSKQFSSFLPIPLPDDNYSGLFCLYEKDGKTDIDVLQSPRAMILGSNIYRNVYSKSNPTAPLTGKPVMLEYSYTGRWFYIFTENQGLRVAPTGLQVMDTWENGMFYNAPTTYKPQRFMSLNNTDFLINNGKLHVLYASIAGDRKFANPIIESGELSPFLSSSTINTYRPVTGAISAYQIVFNKTKGAFQPFYNKGVNFGQFNSPAPDVLFNVNKVEGNPVYINTVNGGETAAIMKLNNGKYMLNVARFYDVVDDGKLTRYYKPLDGLQDLANAKVFESGLGGPAIFYGAGNKVYSYSYTTGQTTSNLIWEGEAGDEVTCMKILPTGGYPSGGRVLWIAVWNEAKNEGKIIDCEINPVSGLLELQVSAWVGVMENPTVTTGFGKVTQMMIKTMYD